MSVWNKLDEMRRQVEGDPFWGAVLGGGIALIIEAGRLMNAQTEAAADKLKLLEDKIAAVAKKAETVVVNIHRQANKKPTLTGIATTITSGNGAVTEISGITNTDQAGKFRINQSSVATPAMSTLFRVNFAVAYAQAPAVFIEQHGGADVGLRVRNVSESGFDVVSGSGLAINTVQELSYLTVPLALTETLA